MTHAMSGKLTDEFMALYRGSPAWAWQFPPSIPLIGERFEPAKGLLIYASAENLAWLDKKVPTWQFDLPIAWNRYRDLYEAEGRDANTFFPNVGIAPVSNGALLCAALHVSEVLNLPRASTPRGFLEHLTVTNFCKYSIYSKSNIDYIDDIEKVRFSLPYVEAELRALQPSVILLPERAWMYREIADTIRAASPKSKVVPAKQFNARVVNLFLSQHDEASKVLKETYELTLLHEWMERLRGINRDSAWRFIAHLQDALDSIR
jgi:hypothetical protein